jgi:3',5'-nucleoside bisphosphate phosphatase
MIKILRRLILKSITKEEHFILNTGKYYDEQESKCAIGVYPILSYLYLSSLPAFKSIDMTNTDLHIHSGYSSDGELEVHEITDRCKEIGIGLFSITDHNSVRGNREVISAGLNTGIHFIPGIEIDCSYNGTDLHLLGYNIDWKSNDFMELEKSIHKKVLDSFPVMIENLEKLGIKVSEKEVLEKAGGKLPSAELIAEVLLTSKNYHPGKILTPYMSGGERSDMPYINFYLDFFAQGKPAYVKIDYMDFNDAVELVKVNNGIPIVAHPGINLKGKEAVTTELLDRGAEGLEIFNNYHDFSQIEFFADLVINRSSLMTCGSDFHGRTKPLIEIGKFKTIEKYSQYLHKSILKISKSVN